MDIVQTVKKLNSISRAQLNFRKRPILCPTLYRNLKQASNFGGSRDQLFLWILLWNFYRRCLSASSLPCCKKVKNGQKLKSRGPALKLQTNLRGENTKHQIEGMEIIQDISPSLLVMIDKKKSWPTWIMWSHRDFSGVEPRAVFIPNRIVFFIIYPLFCRWKREISISGFLFSAKLFPNCKFTHYWCTRTAQLVYRIMFKK